MMVCVCVQPPRHSFLIPPLSLVFHLFHLFHTFLSFLYLPPLLSPHLSFLLPFPEKALTPFSEIALTSLLHLLKKEVSEHSRHLQQYFQAFLNYANKGPFEVCQHTNHFILICFMSVICSEVLNSCTCLTCKSNSKGLPRSQPFPPSSL